MKGQQCEWWCGHRTVVVVVLLMSLCLRGTTATVFQDRSYSYDTMQEVTVMPPEGVTLLCVTPLDDNTRLKVRHTDTAGGRQEVLLKRKSLPSNTLSLLEIEMKTSTGDKLTLTVRLNGTKLQPPDTAPRPTSPAPLHARTSLLLKGNALIRNCKEAAGVLAAPRMMTMIESQREVTQEHGGEVTEGDKVTQEQGKVTEEAKVSEEQGMVTEENKVTEGQSDKVTEEQGKVSSPPPPPPLPSSASTNATLETEDPDLEEEPWWSFVLVLGKVGEVPVLVLLVACLLVGVVVGSVLVCLCSKACQKRRVEYLPVSTLRSHSGHLTGDNMKDPKFWDTVSNKQRSSGIGSAYSTLNTDNGSNMGTVSSRGTVTRLPGSTNGVNNLGQGPSGSPSNSVHRSRNNSSGNVLNIPPGSIPRSSSGRSWDARGVDRSPRLAQGSSVRRTPSNRSNISTSSSINRNTNRSPNIPYTNKLERLTGHQDIPMLQKPVNTHDGSHDSDESWYDEPYITSPIVAENYSVPHVSSTEPVLVEVRTAPANNDRNARQAPVFQFGTFKK